MKRVGWEGCEGRQAGSEREGQVARLKASGASLSSRLTPGIGPHVAAVGASWGSLGPLRGGASPLKRVRAWCQRAWRFGDADYDMPPDLWLGAQPLSGELSVGRGKGRWRRTRHTGQASFYTI